ncbi:MAG: right-handed parallel beta-helix repeat-containing protein [Chitinispirillaceae bacterium]|nr:right-handed parallel beta-helix repeat-containing protein [Chitinispirillaceae bacterium]
MTKLRKVSFGFFALFPLLCSLDAASLNVPNNFPTIAAAMMAAKKGDTVEVEAGSYHEYVYVSPDITLLSRSLFKAILDGRGRGTVVTLGNNSVISGCEVRNGTIGIFSTANGVTISQCRIAFNQQTGIMCVGNLPRIEDNLIVYNKGSGIQGWDVRTTSSSINHNTVAYNGNNGISIGGNSSIILENNIIAYNSQFGLKPSEESVRIQMINNNFYQNAKFTTVLPSDNFSFNPMFLDAPQLNFILDKSSRCIGRASDNQNIGARVVY